VSTGSEMPAAQKGRRRLLVRRAVNAVMVVGLAVGLYALLPRLGGLSRDAAELRHARPAFVAAAVVAQAVSLACYALLYRRVLGVAEVTLVAITAGFGAPRPTAVLAVLGYRIVSYWLPLLPGLVAHLRLRLSQVRADETKLSMQGGGSG
jgi:uncharacterized membrane protein YbhN (UPF0104 family)